jgi:hypothetical protein
MGGDTILPPCHRRASGGEKITPFGLASQGPEA